MARGRPRWTWGLPALYLLLLAISHRVEPPYDREPAPFLETTDVAAMRGDAATPGTVRLAWRRWPPASPPPTDRLPVVLLHGSPGSHDDFDRLAPALAGDGRLALAPDLPGFGASTRRVPDYSIRAHARYVEEWLDRLGVERAHLLGFSMGGGVALELQRSAPRRVASLTLLSSIGVQEMELLGDYALNHALHGLQLGALWTANEALPHFGLLTHFPLDVPYARGFYDTDQRPLRAILGAIEAPVLIVHGERDFLVPPEAAIEHRRLVPQSELLMLDESHFFVFREGSEVAPRLAEFWTRVESGVAATRAGADPDRVALAAAPFDRRAAPRWSGPALLVVGALLALATLVSEDLASIGAGLLVADGRLPFVAASVACCVGILAGDLLLFGAGRVLGRPALRLPPLRWWVSEDAIARSSAWFERRGAVVVLISRFTPGTRLATYVAAGLLRTSFFRFASYMAVAVAVWTPLLVLFARVAGETALARAGALRANLVALLLAPFAILLVVRGLIVPLFTWRGRRGLYGAWKRWTRWEFWPPWLFYPPVVLYALWLGVRHRGLTVFTSANTGTAFPAGGLIGESKASILAALDLACGRGGRLARVAGAADAALAPPPIAVPRWRLIPGGTIEERLRSLRRLRDEEGVAFPIVLKPDVGQRGQGVETVADEAAAARYLARRPAPCIAQQYVGGREFGVFYQRVPGEARGSVLSITEKNPPVLEGDGRSTLEELVLRDRRAVAIARVYRAELGERCDRVPAAGERVKLVDVGTHARGSIFLDGTRHATPALEAAIDEVSRGIDGFFFGRYDVRVASAEDLEQARGLQVLELNGVTAESTDIYDPRNGVVDAWRKLARQWRLAFEIGAANRDRGAPVTSLRDLLGLLWRYRKMLPR
jgi:pimeloyl-ACP methyl ester carboxylesterase/membrane protein DedA with SNARE-associated domain